MVTIGLSRTVSEINGDVRLQSDENRQFSHSPVFNIPAEGVSLAISYRRRGPRKIQWWGFQMVEKKFWIGLAILIQYRSVTDTQSASQPDTLP